MTGSCGKTSTKDLIAHLLGKRCLKTQKNLNNTLGVPLTLTRLDPAEHDYAVVEAGINEPGEMSVLGGMIAPNIACVTMIGPAHLEKLGSLENIAREKAELARHAGPGSSLVCANACLRYESFHHFAGEIFAICAECDEHPALDYTEYRCCTKFFREADGSTRVQVHSAPLAGQFRVRASLTAGMVSNAVMAAVTAILCGAKWEDVQARLLDWTPGADRGSIYRHGENFYYVDCYNANPASMDDALETFQTLAPAELPRLYVLGGMKELGEYSEALHHKVGAGLQLRAQDRAVLIGAEADYYAAGLCGAGASANQLTEHPDTTSAMDEVADFSGAVFVKGSRAYALEKLLPTEIFQAQEAAPC
ncbi:MAG: UDP-N-acetylmuramoyl-tripeptide--D-alanyl-D-alanine ligase [Puniceicoccales bacterium]